MKTYNTFNEYMSFKTDTPTSEVIHNYFYASPPMVELHLREISEQGVSTLSGLAQRAISLMSTLLMTAKSLGFSGSAVKSAKVKMGDVKAVSTILESNYFNELPNRKVFFLGLESISPGQQSKAEVVKDYYALCDILITAVCFLHFHRDTLRLTWNAGRESISEMQSGIGDKTYGELSDAEIVMVVERMVKAGTWKVDPNDLDGRAVRAWIRDNSAKRPEKDKGENVATIEKEGNDE